VYNAAVDCSSGRRAADDARRQLAASLRTRSRCVETDPAAADQLRRYRRQQLMQLWPPPTGEMICDLSTVAVHSKLSVSQSVSRKQIYTVP